MHAHSAGMSKRKATQRTSVHPVTRRAMGTTDAGGNVIRTAVNRTLGGKMVSSPISREWRSHTTASTEGTAHEIWILFDGAEFERRRTGACADQADGPRAADGWTAHRHQGSAPYTRLRFINFRTFSSCTCICNATSARISAASVGSIVARSATGATGVAGWCAGQVEQPDSALIWAIIFASATPPTVPENLTFIFAISGPLPCSLGGWLVGGLTIPEQFRHKKVWVFNLNVRRYPASQPVLNPLHTDAFNAPHRLSDFCGTAELANPICVTLDLIHGHIKHHV